MSTKDTSEPAFPFTCQGPTTAPEFYYGLSMRDYFAAKAIRAQPVFPRNLWEVIKWAFGFSCEASRFCPKQYAKTAYEIADAMLQERSK